MSELEQIEEMAKIASVSCPECYACEFRHLKGKRVSCIDYLVANEFYNAGYRKVDENAVVLTREEKQRLLHEMYEQGKFDAIAELQMEVKIVVSQEEYDNLNEQIKRYQDEREFIGKCLLNNTSKYVELTSDFTDMLDKIYEHACQETANKIFAKLIEVASKEGNNGTLSIGILKAWAIEFDVEVK